MPQDIVFECAFYGRNVRQMGCIYYRPTGTNVEDMELYFAAMYLCRMLSGRQISYQAAIEIQQLCCNGVERIAVLEKGYAENGNAQIAIVDYHAGWSCGLSASMMLRAEKAVFRFGYIGYGWFFKNRKKIAFCCRLSVHGLVDTLLKVRKQDEQLKRRLNILLKKIGTLRLGTDLYLGNYQQCAWNIYQEVLREERTEYEAAGYGA